MSKNVRKLELTIIPKAQEVETEEDIFKRSPRVGRSPVRERGLDAFLTPEPVPRVKQLGRAASTPISGDSTPRRSTRASKSLYRSLGTSPIPTDVCEERDITLTESAEQRGPEPDLEGTLTGDPLVKEVNNEEHTGETPAENPEQVDNRKQTEETQGPSDSEKQTEGTPEQEHEKEVFVFPGVSDPDRPAAAVHFELESNDKDNERSEPVEPYTSDQRSEASSGDESPRTSFNETRIEARREKMAKQNVTLKGSLTAPGSTVAAVPAFISPGCFSPASSRQAIFSITSRSVQMQTPGCRS